MDIETHWEDGKFVMRLGTYEVSIAGESSDEQAARSIEYLTNFYTKTMKRHQEMAEEIADLLERGLEMREAGER